MIFIFLLSANVSFANDLTVFGLKFGEGIEQNKFPKIDNLGMDDEFENISCESEIASTAFGAVPDSWKLNVEDIFGLGKIPRSTQTGFGRNKVKADLSLNGRVTGGWYKVKVLDGEYEICFAYYDNKLFHVYGTYDNLQDIWEDIDVILKSKYGEGDLYGGGGVYTTKWQIAGGLLISKTLPLYLTYTYAPLQSKFLENGIPFYMKKEKEMGKANKNTF